MLEAVNSKLAGLAPSIVVDNVTVTYSNGHTALKNASFELGSGTICALVGVNGSGKSTLFKAIMGYLNPDVGSVMLCGKPAAQALKQNAISYVPQSEDVDWNFPVLVEDVVMMGRYGHMNFLRRASKLDREKVDEALERVDMTEYRSRQIGELSGGQKKRVFLARSLAQESPVILLDEPFTGVDVKTETAIIGQNGYTARIIIMMEVFALKFEVAQNTAKSALQIFLGKCFAGWSEGQNSLVQQHHLIAKFRH